METLYGRYPGELFTLAKNLGDRVAQALMSKYGVLLEEGKVGTGYELAIDDPVASQVQDLRNDVSQLVEVLREVTSKKNVFVPMKDDHYIS